MKNNEILITVHFYQSIVCDNTPNEVIDKVFSFLVLRDITLRELIEGIYYGLSKERRNC